MWAVWPWLDGILWQQGIWIQIGRCRELKICSLNGKFVLFIVLYGMLYFNHGKIFNKWVDLLNGENMLSLQMSAYIL